jgi:glutathione S-transferase
LLHLVTIDIFNPNEEWSKLRRPGAVTAAQSRLDSLATALKDREFLTGEFTAADLVMTTVLRFVRHTTLIKDMPVLAAYQARCEARPAFKRALDAQLAPFAKYQPVAA